MFATPALAGPNWPDVPDPPRSKSEWVARDAVVNGLPSRVERFESDLTPSEVLDFYRARWAGAKAGPPRETNAGGWQGMSTLVDDFQVAVQVRPRSPSGSEGLISTAHFGGVRKDPFPSQLPRFTDTRITQITESIDGNQRSQLVSMVSNESFDLNISRWRGEWLRRGWQVAFEKQSPVDRDGIKTWLASFSKPPQSVDLAMTWRPTDRRTYLTVNLLGPVDGARP
ncbi:hypothetical protein [Ideonella sp.]|uniref:hypothetical protein n=1 Tax=Ideonella sp. TaxID=1929293 RepID=UPI0035B43185